jgi:uncharacterized protein (DUF433 family)/DNA-binding transcriptional MerR regulator
MEAEPAGFYLPGEVGRLAGVSGDQVGQWARYGYMQSAWARRSPRAYAYQDVAEAMVLHYLRDHEVPYPSISKALAEAAVTYGSRWPLSSARLYIVADHPQRKGPKRTVVVDEYDVEANHPVLDHLDLVEVKRDLEHGGWAAREMKLRYIEVNPEMRSGTPVIRGTRVPAEDVAVLSRQPHGLKTLKADYGITTAQAEDARKWFDRVVRYESQG